MLDTLGITESSAAIEFTFLSLYYIALAIGLWSGRSWGWWIAGIFCIYRSVVRIKGLLLLFPWFRSIGLSDVDTSKYITKGIVNLLFYACCLFYLHRPGIIQHFDVFVVSIKSGIFKMILISLAILLCMVIMHTVMVL